MPAAFARSALCLALCCAASLAAGCKNRDGRVARLSDAPPAQRAADSFVHCIEMGSSQCVQSGDTVGGWDAFYILGWLGSGSPVSILEALPKELASHADAKNVQRRFVDEVERYSDAIRGAECDATDMQPIEPLVDQMASAATERMNRLGLWRGDMAEVMQGLVDEAHETLAGGFLVRVECEFDPHRLWIATREQQDGHQSVVGLTTLLPRMLGGEPPRRDDIADRLAGRSLGLASVQRTINEGAVHEWLPFPVEEF